MPKVMTARPTMSVRRGLRLIVDKVIEDFDDGFERVYKGLTAREISDLMEAANWLEQYAVEESDDL